MRVARTPTHVDASVARDAVSSFAPWFFFAILCGYTLCTQDGGPFAPWALSAALLGLTSVVLAGSRKPVRLTLPVGCLLLMTVYGAVQTLWFPHKIMSYGWSGTLFWCTAACIVLIAQTLLTGGKQARHFRLAFVLFGSAVCVVDLLGQADHSSRYFWLIASQYGGVYGPFAYWNNLAEFIELLLPVTLWMGLAGRSPDARFLLLAAIQLGAATASASRAGSVLALAELVVILCVIFVKNRNRSFLYAAIATLLMSVLFVYSAGFGSVLTKLERKDQMAERRDINLSSEAMIAQHPWTGWGLDTYVPVYRMFARFDDGNYVNRAHNDWFQWAAEGGVLFAGTFLVLCLWSVVPAMRTVWGLGVIVLCLHAAVDYPFARIGVCGWYFTLVGMMSVRRGERESG